MSKSYKQTSPYDLNTLLYILQHHDINKVHTYVPHAKYLGYYSYTSYME